MTAPERDALAGCPVCGDAPVHVNMERYMLGGGYELLCQKIGHTVRAWANNEAAARENWNRRAAAPQPAAAEDADDGSLWTQADNAHMAAHIRSLAAERDALRSEVERLRALEGGTSHVEDRCQRCGGRNVTWFADSDLWNRCADRASILCPICFVRAAEAAGVTPTAWRVAPDDMSDEKGRVLVRLHETMEERDALRERVGKLEVALRQIAEMRPKVDPGRDGYPLSGNADDARDYGYDRAYTDCANIADAALSAQETSR